MTDTPITRVQAMLEHDPDRFLSSEEDDLLAVLELAQRAEAQRFHDTDWGSGKDESRVRSCGGMNDAYDYARAYGEQVFTRKLYAGP